MIGITVEKGLVCMEIQGRTKTTLLLEPGAARDIAASLCEAAQEAERKGDEHGEKN